MTRGVIIPKAEGDWAHMASRIEEPVTSAGDIAVGATAEAVEASTDSAKAVNRQATRLERRGAPLNRRLRRQVERATEQAFQTTVGVFDGTIPGQLVLRGVGVVKDRARERDLIGEVAFRYLQLVHGGVGKAARSLARLEDATTPPGRHGGGRTQTSIRRSAGRSAAQEKGGARRTTRRAPARVRRSRDQASPSA